MNMSQTRIRDHLLTVKAQHQLVPVDTDLVGDPATH